MTIMHPGMEGNLVGKSKDKNLNQIPNEIP
jgi:hypothetical protein